MVARFGNGSVLSFLILTCTLTVLFTLDLGRTCDFFFFTVGLTVVFIVFFFV